MGGRLPAGSNRVCLRSIWSRTVQGRRRLDSPASREKAPTLEIRARVRPSGVHIVGAGLPDELRLAVVLHIHKEEDPIRGLELDELRQALADRHGPMMDKYPFLAACVDDAAERLGVRDQLGDAWATEHPPFGVLRWLLSKSRSRGPS